MGKRNALLSSAGTRMGGCVLALLLAGCTHLNVDDCPPGAVLGHNEPGSARLRTSHYRVVLADPAAAAARVLPYALMSAYAYRLGPGCNDAGNPVRVDDREEQELLQRIARTTDEAGKWTRDPEFATRDAQGRLGCEDSDGLMFHVWQRKLENRTHVVVAFRGTSGDGDWVYGNLWWFTRFFLKDNQLTRAARHAQQVIEAYDARAAAAGEDPPRFVSTGHSLGGGLAQHVLYSFPLRVEQAIAFDPSSVTGFADVPRDNQVAGCSCEPEPLRRLGVRLSPEARILRVYQTYEVLANLRIFHKMIFRPERHVQELRFPFEESINPIARHGMAPFAARLFELSGPQAGEPVGSRWIASKEGDACTVPLRTEQFESCQRPVDANALNVCPQ